MKQNTSQIRLSGDLPAAVKGLADRWEWSESKVACHMIREYILIVFGPRLVADAKSFARACDQVASARRSTPVQQTLLNKAGNKTARHNT